MAIANTMSDNHVKGVDALNTAKSRTVEGSIGKTDRGTAIVQSNTTMGQNSFLKLLVAQMQNLDPSKEQDSTAYITQMAEFASIEQLNNLNTSITDFANQQKVGQVAIINDHTLDGKNKWGIVTQIFKQGSTTYATIQDTSTGELSTYDIKKIIGTSDSGYSSANFETALNSKFLSASTLAAGNANAVVVERVTEMKKDKDGNYEKDKDGNPVYETKIVTHKVQLEGAYLDKQNSKIVMKVVMLDDEGKPTDVRKEFSYDEIASAGALTNDQLNEIIKNLNGNSSAKSRNSTRTPDNLNLDDKIANQTHYYPRPATGTGKADDKKTESTGSDDKTVNSEAENENKTNSTEANNTKPSSSETDVKENEQNQKEMKTLEKMIGK